MSFFQKLFGKSNPADSLRRAYQQNRWSDVLIFADDIDFSQLDSDLRDELSGFVTQAGDQLAEVNLSEGEAFLRSGDIGRAAEHFSLSLNQAKTPALLQKAQSLLKGLAQTSATPSSPAPQTASAHAGCGSSCGSGGAHGCGSDSSLAAEDVEELDDDTHLELLLGSYPHEWQRQAELAGETFRRALLYAHQGETDQALDLLEKVSASEHNDLFFFERGSLKARQGKIDSSLADFLKCLESNPDNLTVFDSLIGVELSAGRFSNAEKRLAATIEQGRFLPYCHGRMTLLLYRKGEHDGALEHGLRALEMQTSDGDAIAITGILLERSGRLREAEQALALIKGGGGCSGSGANLHLAEFWLRHKKNLEKALEAFKGAAREESGNPRWALRIGQTYLAMGWKKEGKPLVEKALNDTRLDPALRKEALDLLATSN